jgi:ketosteroid isomerase-like protein
MLLETEETMNQDLKALTLEYLEAVGGRDYEKLEKLFVPDLTFREPANTRSSAADFIGALKRLSAIHVRNDVKRVFVDGDEVCVIYDFVTDTSAGALSTIEWLHFEGGRIRSIQLYYDRLPWESVMKTIAERAAQPAA